MASYSDIIIQSYTGYAYYLANEILYPSWHNYFYWLLGLSLFCWLLEILFPWRTQQAIVRRDFWLDGFYLFFNFFLFSLIGFNALSGLVSQAFNDLLLYFFGVQNIVAIRLHDLPVWSQLLLMLVIRDFLHWNIHRLLHRVPFLWEFHKVHHSVAEMGFAAHLRYHWAETIVYRSLEYIPLAMLGFGIQDFFVVHIFSLAIGHLNHSNVYLPVGKLRYVLNTPQMHIWHHAEALPPHLPNGANFGLTLSVWDYLFGTAYIPNDGRDIKLGFEQVESFPKGFWQQMLFPFKHHH